MMTTHFFLGANSGQGFQNLFERFCRDEEHYDLLVLKGGPGAGKSTMMKKIGAAMEARGEQVEYLFCSGDPDSLDGVSIPRIKTAVVDGTSPHIIEPRYPAAVDRYVNLGQFYDIAAAKAARDEIVQRSQVCSAAYRRAYHALSAAGSLEDSAAALMQEGFDDHKLVRRAEGILAREIRGHGAGAQTQYRFLGSITHKGAIWRFDTVETLCPRIYRLSDSAGLAHRMLAMLHEEAIRRQYATIVCPNPEHIKEFQHLLIPELGVAFVTTRDAMAYEKDSYRCIHIDEMVSADHRKQWKGRLKLLRKLAKTLREEGVACLREAKAAHDALEEIYRPHVDFQGVNALTAQEIERMTQYL